VTIVFHSSNGMKWRKWRIYVS